MTTRLGARWRVLAAGAALAVAGSLALQAPAQAALPKPTQTAGKLSVCGTKICDKNGKPVQLRGMSTHGLHWTEFDGCLSDTALDKLAWSWKADVMRLSMYTQKGDGEDTPGYADTNDAGRKVFDKKIDNLIDKSNRRGMYNIADWHILPDNNPMKHKEQAKKFFARIAQKHGSKGTVMYEIANEPSSVDGQPKVSWDVIKKYADEIIPVIRKYDPNGIILVGTPDWSSLGVSGDGNMVQQILKNPVKGSNIMYTFHYYAASHGVESGDPYYKAIDEASKKLPMFVTEWGMEEYTGDGKVDKAQSERFLKLLDQRQISWAKWNYADNGYSGSAFKSGTCAKGGPFDGASLTESGAWVRDKIRAGQL